MILCTEGGSDGETTRKLVKFIQKIDDCHKANMYQFFLFFHERYWGKLPHPRSKNMCSEIWRKMLHKSRSCCVGVSHNSRWKRADQTFFISINNMLLFICVKRFTESFLLALDHSSWQQKHRNFMNKENQRRRKMALQSYWDPLPWQFGLSHIK